MSRGMKLLIGVVVLAVVGSTVQGLIQTPAASAPAAAPVVAPRAPSSGPAVFSDSAIVWTDRDAMKRGMDLLSSGAYNANPQLLVPLISCFVAPGTAATVIRLAGMGVREVAVDDGPHRGCTGMVVMEVLRRR